MKARKILVSLAALALVAALSVAGTLAYLTDSKNVTNTFTVGDIEMTLTEEDVTKADGSRTASGNTYKLYPGQTYTKDPTVTILANSEDCYVRMLVEVKNIDQLKAAFPQNDAEGKPIVDNAKYYAADGTFLIQYLCNEWNSTNWPCTGVKTDEATKTATYEFRYKNIVKLDKDNNQELVPLFKSITVPGTVDNDALAALGKVEINIIGNAIQTQTFADADAAWKAF